MASGEQLAAVDNWFGFAELSNEPSTSKPVNALLSNTGQLGEEVDQAHRHERIKTLSRKVDEKSDQNEIVVPIVSTKSGIKKYKVLARQKVEDDEVIDETEKDKDSDDDSPPITALHYVGNNTWRGTYNRFNKSFIPASSVRYCSDSGKVEIATEKIDKTQAVKELGDSKVVPRDKVSGESKKSKKVSIRVDSKEVPYKRKKKVALCKIENRNDEERSAKNVLEHENQTDDTGKELSKSDEPDMVINEGKGKLDSSECDKTDVVSCSAAEQKEECKDSIIQECEQPQNSVEKYHCENEGDRIDVSLCPCAVKLKRDPSIDMQYVLDTGIIKSKSEESTKLIQENDGIKQEKQQIEVTSVSEDATVTLRRHSADEKSEPAKPIQRQTSMDEFKSCRMSMVYNPELVELRKSGRLKSAKCSSRYRGDYGIRAETYSRLITCLGSNSAEDTSGDSEKEGSMSNESCNGCETEAMDTVDGAMENKRKISFCKDSLVLKKKLKVGRRIIRTRKLFKRVPKSNLSSRTHNIHHVNHNDNSEDNRLASSVTETEADSEISDKDKLTDAKSDPDEISKTSGLECEVPNNAEVKNCDTIPSKDNEACSSEDCRWDHKVEVLAQTSENTPISQLKNTPVTTSECSCACNSTVAHNCQILCTHSEEKQICDNQEQVPCSAERKHYCDKISYELVCDLKASGSAFNSASEGCQDPQTVVQMETDSECAELPEQFCLKTSHHLDYVHSVGKSVNKKQNQVIDRIFMQAEAEKAKIHSADMSPDFSPTKEDPVTILEDLRMKLFEKAGASVQVSDKPKQFECKLISSKRRGSAGTGNHTPHCSVENSEMVEEDISTIKPCNNIPGKSTPILQEVAKSLDIIQQAKRKAEETKTEKATKPKRQRFEQKKFMLRSMIKDRDKPTHGETKNHISETSANGAQCEVISDISFQAAVNTNKEITDSVVEVKKDFESVKKSAENLVSEVTLNEDDILKDDEQCGKVMEDDKKDVTTKTNTKTKLPNCSKQKSIKCQACNHTFRSKELLRKHYPCRIRQTRTWSQNILRPNRPFKRNEKKEEKFKCKLPKSLKTDGKSRPQLLKPRKTKFRRVKGKRRRRLHQLLHELRVKRKVVQWPHLSVSYEKLSYKEQCMYKIGLSCTGKPAEGLENYTKEDHSLFEAHRIRQKEVDMEPFEPTPNDQEMEELSTESSVEHKNESSMGVSHKEQSTDGKLSDSSNQEVQLNVIKDKYESQCTSDLEQSTNDEISSQLGSSYNEHGLCNDMQEEVTTSSQSQEVNTSNLSEEVNTKTEGYCNIQSYPLQTDLFETDRNGDVRVTLNATDDDIQTTEISALLNGQSEETHKDTQVESDLFETDRNVDVRVTLNATDDHIQTTEISAQLNGQLEETHKDTQEERKISNLSEERTTKMEGDCETQPNTFHSDLSETGKISTVAVTLNVTDGELQTTEREDLESDSSCVLETMSVCASVRSYCEPRICNETQEQACASFTFDKSKEAEAYETPSSPGQWEHIENGIDISCIGVTSNSLNEAIHTTESEDVESDSCHMGEQTFISAAEKELPEYEALKEVIAIIDGIISEVINLEEESQYHQMNSQHLVANPGTREENGITSNKKDAYNLSPDSEPISAICGPCNTDNFEINQEENMHIARSWFSHDQRKIDDEVEKKEIRVQPCDDFQHGLKETKTRNEEYFPFNNSLVEPCELFSNKISDVDVKCEISSKGSVEAVENSISKGTNSSLEMHTGITFASNENIAEEETKTSEDAEGEVSIANCSVVVENHEQKDSKLFVQELYADASHVHVENPCSSLVPEKGSIQYTNHQSLGTATIEIIESNLDVELDNQQDEEIVFPCQTQYSDDQSSSVAAYEMISQVSEYESKDMLNVLDDTSQVQEHSNEKGLEDSVDMEHFENVPGNWSTSSPYSSSRFETSQSSSIDGSEACLMEARKVDASNPVNINFSETGDDSSVIICYEQNGVIISENLMTGDKSVVPNRKNTEAIDTDEIEYGSSSQDTENINNMVSFETDTKISTETCGDIISRKDSNLNVDNDSILSSPNKSYETNPDICDSDTNDELYGSLVSKKKENTTSVIHYEENGVAVCEDLLTGEKMVVRSKPEQSGSQDESSQSFLESKSIDSVETYESVIEEENIIQTNPFKKNSVEGKKPVATKDDSRCVRVQVQENLPEAGLNYELKNGNCHSQEISEKSHDTCSVGSEEFPTADQSVNIPGEITVVNETCSTNTPETAIDNSNDAIAILKENKEIYNVDFTQRTVKECQTVLYNSALNIATENTGIDENECDNYGQPAEINHLSECSMDRDSEVHVDSKSCHPGGDENLASEIVDKNMPNLSIGIHNHSSDIEEMRSSLDASLVTEQKDVSVYNISISDEPYSVQSVDNASLSVELDSSQEIDNTDIQSPSIIDIETPPVLEKVEDMCCLDDLPDKTLLCSDDSMLSSSDPPTLIPEEETAQENVSLLEETPLSEDDSVQKEIVCTENDSKKPRAERHFLDVLGDVGQNSDALSNSLNRDTPKVALDKPSEDEDFIGRHFSDVIDNTVKNSGRQQTNLPHDFDESGQRKVTIAKLREILKPAHKKDKFLTTESLLKLRSDVVHLFKKVKVPVKKDPAWLKRDFLKAYRRRKQKSHKQKSNNNISEKYRLHDSDDLFSDEREQSEGNEECADDESELSDWEEEISEDDSRNSEDKSKTYSQATECSAKFTKGGITENILQMLTSIEDKGNVAVNLSNLLDILAKNLGFSNTSAEGVAYKLKEFSSDSDSDYSCTEAEVIENRDVNTGLFKESFSMSFEGDEPPSIDDIPFPDDDSMTSIVEKQEESEVEIQADSLPENSCHERLNRKNSADVLVTESVNCTEKSERLLSLDAKGSSDEKNKKAEADTEDELHELDTKQDLEQTLVSASIDGNISAYWNAKSNEEEQVLTLAVLKDETREEPAIEYYSSMPSQKATQCLKPFDIEIHSSDAENSSNRKSGKGSTNATCLFQSITELNTIETDDDSNLDDSFDAVSMSRQLCELKAFTGNVSDTDVQSEISNPSDNEELTENGSKENIIQKTPETGNHNETTIESENSPSKSHSSGLHENLIIKESAESVDDKIMIYERITNTNISTSTLNSDQGTSQDGSFMNFKDKEESLHRINSLEVFCTDVKGDCSVQSNSNPEANSKTKFDDTITKPNKISAEIVLLNSENDDFSTVQNQTKESKVMQDISILDDSVQEDVCTSKSVSETGISDCIPSNAKNHVTDQDKAINEKMEDARLSNSMDSNQMDATQEKVLETNSVTDRKCNENDSYNEENGNSEIAREETCKPDKFENMEADNLLDEFKHKDEGPGHKTEKDHIDDIEETLNLRSTGSMEDVSENVHGTSENCTLVRRLETVENNFDMDMSTVDDAFIPVGKPIKRGPVLENEDPCVPKPENILHSNEEYSRVSNLVRTQLETEKSSYTDDNLPEKANCDLGVKETNTTITNTCISNSVITTSLNKSVETFEGEESIANVFHHTPQIKADGEDARSSESTDESAAAELDVSTKSVEDISIDVAKGSSEIMVNVRETINSVAQSDEDYSVAENLSCNMLSAEESNSLEITENVCDDHFSNVSSVESIEQTSAVIKKNGLDYVNENSMSREELKEEKSDRKMSVEEEDGAEKYKEDLINAKPAGLTPTKLDKEFEKVTSSKGIFQIETSDLKSSKILVDEDSDCTVNYDEDPETSQNMLTQNKMNGILQDHIGIETDTCDMSLIQSEKTDDHSEKENFPVQEIPDDIQEYPDFPNVYFETIAEKVKRKQRERLLRQSRSVTKQIVQVTTQVPSVKEISVFRRSMLDKRLRQNSLSSVNIKYHSRKKRKRCSSVPKGMKIAPLFRNISLDIKPCSVKLKKLSQSTIQKYLHPPRPPIKLKIKLSEIIMPCSPYSSFPESSTEDEITEEPDRSPICSNKKEQKYTSNESEEDIQERHCNEVSPKHRSKSVDNILQRLKPLRIKLTDVMGMPKSKSCDFQEELHSEHVEVDKHPKCSNNVTIARQICRTDLQLSESDSDSEDDLREGPLTVFGKKDVPLQQEDTFEERNAASYASSHASWTEIKFQDSQAKDYHHDKNEDIIAALIDDEQSALFEEEPTNTECGKKTMDGLLGAVSQQVEKLFNSDLDKPVTIDQTDKEMFCSSNFTTLAENEQLETVKAAMRIENENFDEKMDIRAEECAPEIFSYAEEVSDDIEICEAVRTLETVELGNMTATSDMAVVDYKNMQALEKVPCFVKADSVSSEIAFCDNMDSFHGEPNIVSTRQGDQDLTNKYIYGINEDSQSSADLIEEQVIEETVAEMTVEDQLVCITSYKSESVSTQDPS